MSDTVDRLVSALDAERERLARAQALIQQMGDEQARLWAAVERVRDVLEAAGCDCECAPICGTEHDDDCERCLGCRVESAIRGAR
jgi:hypothetical protein